MNDWLGIPFAFGLVFANAFFVAFEFALVRVRPTELQTLKDTGRAQAEATLAMRNRLDTWMSACQVGNTLAALALGWIGEPAFEHLAVHFLSTVAPQWDAAQALVRPMGIFFAFSTITFLHIVIGEQVPKMFAITYPAKTALSLGVFMRGFRFLFFPVIVVLDAGTRLGLRLLGFNSTANAVDAHSKAELLLILESSARAGQVSADQAELVENALLVMEKTARQVMVPRSQMVVLDLDDPSEENLATAFAAGPTWLPVVRGSLDNVEGVVSVKDLAYLHWRRELTSLAQAQRPIFFVPETVTVQQLLIEFRRRNKSIAIVVDEHGGTSGLVSISDVLGELVGSVADAGRATLPLQALSGGPLELAGTADLKEVERTFKIVFDVDHAEVTTIAGYLMAKFGRIPKVGDTWLINDLRLVVTAVDGPRVLGVRMEPKSALPVPAAVAPRPSAPSPSAP